MARTINRLSAQRLNKLPAGLHADGQNLYVLVSKTGSKSWVYRYRDRGGAQRDRGLGPVRLIGLAEARSRALDLSKRRYDGADIPVRRAVRAGDSIRTFEFAMEQWLDMKDQEWTGAKQRRDVEGSLRKHAAALLPRDAAHIDTAAILAVLKTAWENIPVTASRVRQHIEAILSWAGTAGLRSQNEPNPARWEGHLEHMLPAVGKVAAVEHHKALPYTEMPEFMKALRADALVEARALELLALTAVRLSDVTAAAWTEIDLFNRLWTISKERMKSRRDHRVPLSDAAIRILEARLDADTNDSGLVFLSKRGRPLRDKSASGDVLDRIGYGDRMTAHGLRSTFRDWCADVAQVPREVAEAALAHKLKDKTEAAYARTDHLDQRRELMTRWADYLAAGG